MDAIDRLAELFEKFPGVGPRQAHRFVQYLLRATPSLKHELADALRELSSSVKQCPECMRYHSDAGKLCAICADAARSKETLAVVAADADVAALETSGMYRGRYFVLGGTLSLASENARGLRLSQLVKAVGTRDDLQEVILAFPANPEGDATGERVRDDLHKAAPSLRITSLGRGLSTGSELEYADPETLKNALNNRK